MNVLKTAALVVCALVVLFLPDFSYARYHPGIRWKTASNDHFTVYFPEGHETFARRVLLLSDEVYGDVTGYLGVKPRKTPVVLNPDTDSFNGFYAPFPNRISLYETPDADLKGFGSSLNDLVDLVYTHEYAHFAHLTTRRGWYGALTRVFGEGLAISNIVSPGWAIEGITTNLETKFTTGGRGKSPLFRSIVPSFMRDGNLWGLSASGTESPYYPPLGRIYHSGLFMIEYLNKTYGDDAFARLSLYQAAHPIGLTGGALKHVTGKSPLLFYREYQKSVAAISDSLQRSADVTNLPAGQVILQAELDGYTSHFWTEQGTIIALRRGYSKKTTLVEINPLTEKKIKEINTGILFNQTPVRCMPDGRLVFGKTFFHPLGELEIDVSDLVVFDPYIKKLERLTRNAHIFSADISPDSRTFAAVRRRGMWSELILLDSDGSNIRALVSDPGYYWQSPCWSPDGETIAVTVKVGSFTDIALVNPQNSDVHTLFAPDEYGDGDPSFSPDGQWLVFSSSRGGIWNIYAWNMMESRLFQLTSVNTAALEPRVSPDGGTLSFLTRSQTSYEIRILPFEPLKGKEISVNEGGKLPEPDLEHLEPVGELQTRSMPLWEAYKPYIHIPYIDSDEKGTSAGMYIMGGDPVNINSYTARLLYGLNSERLGYDVSLKNTSFWPVISARVYDTSIKENIIASADDFWYRERGSELSISLNVIHRVFPDIINSRTVFGTRMRHFMGNGEVTFNPENDFSTSFYSYIMLQQITDSAPRDMVPGWSRMLYVSREEGVESLGGEYPGHNQVVIANQFIPSPFRHHGFELSLFHQRQTGRLRYVNTGLIPRGFDNGDTRGGFNLDKTLSFTFEYRFPLLFMDRGLGLNLIHFNLLRGSLFVDHGAGWQDSFDAAGWGSTAQTSIGATLTTRTNVFSFIPVETGLTLGYKTRENESFARFIIFIDTGELEFRHFLKKTPYSQFMNRRMGHIKNVLSSR